MVLCAFLWFCLLKVLGIAPVHSLVIEKKIPPMALFTASLLRRKYLLWRCALHTEQLGVAAAIADRLFADMQKIDAIGSKFTPIVQSSPASAASRRAHSAAYVEAKRPPRAKGVIVFENVRRNSRKNGLQCMAEAGSAATAARVAFFNSASAQSC